MCTGGEIGAAPIQLGRIWISRSQQGALDIGGALESRPPSSLADGQVIAYVRLKRARYDNEND